MIDRKPLFIDDEVISVKKSGKRVFGDFFTCIRNENNTDFILCDGIGSGVKASIAAKMCASRISTLLASGMSVRKVAEKAAHSMNGIRSRDIPYSVFIIIRILADGNFHASGYEMPVPVILYESEARKADARYYPSGGEVLFDCAGSLLPGMSMVLCSDGITQAGMGKGLSMGWTEDGLADWLCKRLESGLEHKITAEKAFEHAVMLSDGYSDDMTLALLTCRNASPVNLLTGPPSDKLKDICFTQGFLSSPGMKIICGSSTLDMVSGIMGKNITSISPKTFSRPPEYSLPGIHLAAEGAVTLNQLYNILEEDRTAFDEKSVVTEICIRLQDADIIHFFIGDAVNKGHDSIVFKQTGILPRRTIVPLIINKLKEMGKIITVTTP